MRNKLRLLSLIMAILFFLPVTSLYAKEVITQDTPPPQPAGVITSVIGTYTEKSNEIILLERNGRLFLYTPDKNYLPLEIITKNSFKISGGDLFGSQKIIITRNKLWKAMGFSAGKHYFNRKFYGNEGGESFKIKPLRPIEEIRKEALKATPPPQGSGYLKPDLVDVTKVDPNIKLDIRYATDNNFMGTGLYDKAAAFMQRPAAQALGKACLKLRKKGYGVIIFDAYRPWYVTKMFWDATPDHQKEFVANPQSGSRHNRGTAVDLTLYDLKTGKEVEMTGGYDEFSNRSYPNYPGGTSRQRHYREVLRKAMESEGFTVNDSEWWHFDYKDWKKYPVMNKTFDEVEKEIGK